jgi:pantothenate kinase
MFRAREHSHLTSTSMYQAFADFVTSLRHSSRDKGTLKAPSFSHSLKDPVADDVLILPKHKVVILEGLYANINEGEWVRAAALYNQRWVVDCDERIARTRLIARHVITGVAKDEQEAAWRGE